MDITWFRKCIAIFVVVNMIILFLLARWNPSWTITNLFTETIKSLTHETQSEVFWTIPGNGSSLLPLTNSSIVVYIDLNQRRQQLRKKNKACRYIKGNPTTLFRNQPSTTTSKFTAELDRSGIMHAFLCGGVLYPDFLKALPRETLYPFEAFYLSDPPLWNKSTVAYHGHSTLSLAGLKRSFVVGDIVSLVITMFDRVGRPRMKGGDRIKVWIKDVEFNHSISAKITDFNNGTYLATTVLPWAGTVRAMATLREPREYFRALAYVHRALKTTLPFAGAYINSKASEAVPCNPFPIVPGFHRSELCNLTWINGSPWFCGRPRKQELKCSDYQFVTYSRLFIDLPVTPAEDKLLKQKENQTNFLKGDIVLKVEPTQSGITRIQDPEVPCNQVSPRSTWHQAVPNGYFYNKVWKSFLCYMSENVDQSCFQNVHVVFYGDSNSREIYNRFKSHIPCNETRFGTEEANHTPKICVNDTYNFSVEHISHESPFHMGCNALRNHSWLYSPERLFGSIPLTGRYIIIIDRYLHLTTFHISALERVLVEMREAIIRLLQRNPGVLIMFKGPHVAEHGPYIYNVGDAWAEYYTSILRETFKDLQDRVIYLPTWDMTVADENTNIHPKCNHQISHVMLQFLCGRVNSSFLRYIDKSWFSSLY